MDINKEYASKGVAGAGLGTGIAGLSLGVINAMGGLAGLGGLFNNRASACGNDMLSAAVLADCLRGRGSVPCGSDCDPVTQREMRLVQEIAAKDSQIALRDANTYGDQKALEMYKYVDGRFRAIEAQLGQQPFLKLLIDLRGLPASVQTEKGLHMPAAQVLPAGLKGQRSPGQPGRFAPPRPGLQQGKDL